MSDTKTVPDVEPLELPEREGTTSFNSRKTLYVAGEVNEFTYTSDGEEHEGYITFDAARLISAQARVQVLTRGKNKGKKALVVSQGIVIDNPVIGRVENGELVPHPLHREPRYAAWQNSNRPKRINAQQWVQAENYQLVKDYANFLHQECGFSLVRKPTQPEGSQRKTKDLFVARPSNGRDITDRTEYGVKLDAFEVSVNPDYPQGFKSFVNGLNEQMIRWEAAVQEEKEDLRTQMLENIAQNIHFLGGVYRDEEQHTWWARPVDVGMVVIDGTELPLYHVRGSELDDDLFSEVIEDAGALDDGPSEEALALPEAGF